MIISSKVVPMASNAAIPSALCGLTTENEVVQPAQFRRMHGASPLICGQRQLNVCLIFVVDEFHFEHVVGKTFDDDIATRAELTRPIWPVWWHGARQHGRHWRQTSINRVSESERVFRCRPRHCRIA